MLSFLRVNNPSIVFFNIFLIIAFRIIAFIYPFDTTNTFLHDEPLSTVLSTVYYSLGSLGYPIFIVLGGIVVFIQSLYINKIANYHRFSSRKTFLGGIIYICFVSFFKQFLILSPVMMATTFLVLIVDDLFNLAKQEKMPLQVFNLGFHSMLATLFYFPSILFIAIVYIGMYTVRAITFKENIIVWMGVLSPILVTFTWYFWMDNLSYLPFYITNFLHKKPLYIRFHWQYGWVMIWLSLLFIWSLFNVQFLLSSAGILVRKFVGIFIFMLFFLIGGYFLQTNFIEDHWLLLSLPLAMLVFLYFVETKINFISEILFILLILSVFISQIILSIF